MPAVQEKKKARSKPKRIRKFRRGHWLKMWQAWNHRHHAVRNELRNKGLFVAPDHGIVRLNPRRYAFALLAEDEPYLLPSLGYLGPGEVSYIWRKALAETMSNIEDTIRKAITDEFNKRDLATKADLKLLATQASVDEIGKDVKNLALAIDELRTFVESQP